MAAAAPQAPQAQGRRAAIASCMFMLVLATASLSAAQTIPKPAPKASPAAATPGLTYTIDNTPNNFPITFTDFAAVPKPAACKSGPRTKRLPATKDTVHWGYWYGGAKPAAVVASGDTITVEMLTHQAGDAADLMIQGDKPVEAIYQWTKDNMTIPFRGYSGRGDGKHILTGPIHICGAEPGDTVKIEILDLYPRPNPLTNKTYGSQAAARWGWQFKTGFASGLPREVVNIYELVKSPRAGDSTIMYAAPRFSFAATQDDPANVSDIVITTPCQPDEYSVPRTYPGFGYTLKNPDRLYPAIGKVPCVNGTQTWPRIVLGGMVRPNSAPRSTSVNGKFRVPINLHIGNIGLAQPISIPFTSTTPTNTGNNLDNRRLGKGATLYLPVKVYGGLLQMGDCHAAQGDSEYDGTAIETSITGDFKITLLKAATAPIHLRNISTPIIENANEWVVQGHTYLDYIKELYSATPGANATAEPAVLNPQAVIATKSSLDKAFNVSAIQTRDFLLKLSESLGKTLAEDDAISLMTGGVDFAVTQVVDQNWGVHTVIPKWVFQGKTDGSVYEEYSPVSFPGTSLNGTCKYSQKYAYKRA